MLLGEMAERSKAAVLKTAVGLYLPRVRIPFSPPLYILVTDGPSKVRFGGLFASLEFVYALTQFSHRSQSMNVFFIKIWRAF